MERILLFLFLITPVILYARINTFPASDNVGIRIANPGGKLEISNKEMGIRIAVRDQTCMGIHSNRNQ
ncbi:hypothetical protein SAMN02927921_04090 [Sinomicrobium oceani]|uniref:Uncharacterized protein n=1 Tax=Sinomicrobium oceani TaxID=1150368 RepID=A0A1K1RVT4_9FLAO|nr:hypothetical protein [Sinomicrobium oceani]SFW76209.1 hypothetical protein SAMN02927921_04090 [Sinomicrobium oceani]